MLLLDVDGLLRGQSSTQETGLLIRPGAAFMWVSLCFTHRDENKPNLAYKRSWSMKHIPLSVTPEQSPVNYSSGRNLVQDPSTMLLP